MMMKVGRTIYHIRKEMRKMIEQYDLFSTSNCDFEEEQKEKEKQRNKALLLERKKQERLEFLTKNLNRRQHALIDYLEDNFVSGKYFTIEEIVANLKDKDNNPYYKLNTNLRIHDKCASLGADIRAINWKIGYRYSVIVKDKKGSCKICESQQEFDEWKESEKKPLITKLEYLNNLSYKASWQDTAPLLNLNDRPLELDEIEFIDVFKGEDYGN